MEVYGRLGDAEAAARPRTRPGHGSAARRSRRQGRPARPTRGGASIAAFDYEPILVRCTAERCTGRTSFVIAHRLSTLRDADVIVAIEDGLVADVGRHDELMAAKGFYHQLYMSQFRGDATPADL